MTPSQAQVPEGIRRSIAGGRFSEAADALRSLVQREPSVAILVALADMNFQLGDLTEAKDNALRAVAADPRDQAARVLLGRVRAAQDERDGALADFSAALELARPRMAPAGGGPVAVPAHQALHNLEQLTYLEQVDNLPPGTLLPVPADLREVARRKLNQVLEGAGSEIPSLPMGGQYGRMLADPPLVRHEEPLPARCLNPRDDWSDVVNAFKVMTTISNWRINVVRQGAVKQQIPKKSLGKVRNRFKFMLLQKAAQEGESISLRDVARETGVSVSTWSLWLNNRVTRYDAGKLAVLCDYFKCSPGDLLSYTPPEQPK